ncbi:hypothetical protein KP79_PYT12758 [Mizuhopecten yessoensis]|uniref:Uncharacterized protein n=1 Tax=Mizuhopecten yessoensis TaxID=6573 RepID=A0A210Q989_MIZYE|nr:hypothetical protein KP79_PYT12758 [Mizuhopecten yessoensis]
MDRRDIPQMVYFGFDDAVTPEGSKHYNVLFRRSRANPNGCPIGATLYILHQNTLRHSKDVLRMRV